MATNGRKLRILAVDDDDDILALYRYFLSRDENIDLVTTLYPERAAELLEQEMFDLLITDWEMPTMKGCELIKLSRDQVRNVIMITGSEPTFSCQGSCRPDLIIAKPIDRATLINAIQAHAA
jgi:DNA-binding response OmpR family regulator